MDGGRLADAAGLTFLAGLFAVLGIGVGATALLRGTADWRALVPVCVLGVLAVSLWLWSRRCRRQAGYSEIDRRAGVVRIPARSDLPIADVIALLWSPTRYEGDVVAVTEDLVVRSPVTETRFAATLLTGTIGTAITGILADAMERWRQDPASPIELATPAQRRQFIDCLREHSDAALVTIATNLWHGHAAAVRVKLAGVLPVPCLEVTDDGRVLVHRPGSWGS